MLVFDHNRARRQIRELRAIANDMEKNRSIKNAMDNVRISWVGNTSNGFQRRCNELSELIRREVANIRRIADSLEASCNAIEIAERQAQEALTNNVVRNT